LAAIALLAPATAQAVHFPNQGGCSDPGASHGFCSALRLRSASIPFFELLSFEGSGRYDLCFRVHAVPEVCLTRKLRYDRENKAWIARVRIDKTPKLKDGQTIARWVDPTTKHRLGPLLHFTTVSGETVEGKATTEFRRASSV
jgi:hypothetical protein